jgi:hypothetical protein
VENQSEVTETIQVGHSDKRRPSREVFRPGLLRLVNATLVQLALRPPIRKSWAVRFLVTFFAMLYRGIAVFARLVGMVFCLVVITRFMMSRGRMMMLGSLVMFLCGIHMMLGCRMFEWHVFLLPFSACV